MDRSEKFWNKSAAGYDREEMKDAALRHKVLERTRQYLRKTDSVLDVGCATGILANEIARDVHAVNGIDISSGMIEIARSKAEASDIRNVDYTQTTVFDEHFMPGAFDVVLSIYMLHLLEDMPGALKRMHALLKPGGLFISVTPCLGKSIAGMALLLAGKTGLVPRLQLFNVHGLEGLITHAGFMVLQTDCLQRNGRQQFIVAQKP